MAPAPTHPPNPVNQDSSTWKTSNQVVVETNALIPTKTIEQVFPVSTGLEHQQSTVILPGVPVTDGAGGNVFEKSQVTVMLHALCMHVY